MLEKTKYDVFLIDINLGNGISGIEFAEQVRMKQLEASIILYTGELVENYYSLIIEQKVDNILSKTATRDTLLNTIYAAVHNKVLISKNFIYYINRQLDKTTVEKKLRLNARQKQILEMVGEGYTNKGIASELDVVERTVENNLSQIYNLLNVETRIEAVIKAKEWELI
ncbi:response regulator transcription factor [Metasolibacillus meyeri]|uniref:Response regulator transcription factor n=1 Tax=Metasolibacillus meyeri TaxID=1071052 RepID=A0AAW9NP14_9BACL|nr:response regulator transcription factor [Metasolibacillus meyeri]MEC1177024.1 response regulator transcription factor [Metasolibacillus meyeri]